MLIHLPPAYPPKSSIHPWNRSHKCNISAWWETDENSCEKVAKWRTFTYRGKNTPLFFDIVDASVFDFLMDDGDRHNYEVITINYTPRMILLDNGRGMGNSYIDHIDILAPLFQCCFLRNSTWNTLLDLRGGNLSYWLRYLITFNNSNPEIILTEKHFKAFDRRLLIIFAVLEDCFLRKGKKNVILND
ncbi:glycosaminoglycan xylosylkinase-like [Planococcus citri]|uniref:glycosaminoglycan xylosylkinase-like n=1 Tax=Planococcus citri TaxID=170843 RepID=UPI0031F87DF9